MRNKEEEKRRRGEEETGLPVKHFFPVLILIFVSLFSGCQPNQEILKSKPPPPTPADLTTTEEKKTSVEEDLREMETAGFDFVFVFRRKDGGVIDKDDQKYLRANTPIETNRWRKSDNGRAFIAGSGFAFTPEQLKALRDRFVVEDHSKPEAREAADKAFNANTKKPAANK
ncbi:MAG: hypothetical protein JSS81_14695 [Acidobacteria bacterium]|nr:hypothetical protein [Acidobacteriota bacterium]